ncbi:MAG: phytanoyl-CoA dioxygenase family protein [Rhizobacter sp.]
MSKNEPLGLWVDRPNALEILDHIRKINPVAAKHFEKLKFFVENGYVIFESAVTHAKIDKYLDEFDKTLRSESGMLASVPMAGPQDKSLIPAHEATRGAPLTKYLDTYWMVPSAIPLIFNRNAQEFLSLIFEDSVYAFQGLHFEVGSTQAIHQDTAYVVTERPRSLAASWCALEDIQAGSGELIYYEGSHRLPDWKYSGKFKHFNHERDAHQEHLDHLAFLKSESEKRGFPLKRFLPRKGDVLIWAADLAHGGAQIENQNITRKSLVTHFCPGNLKPHYLQYLPKTHQIAREYPGLGKASTFYYPPGDAPVQRDLRYSIKSLLRSLAKRARRLGR